jgi:hypothetical protein
MRMTGGAGLGSDECYRGASLRLWSWQTELDFMQGLDMESPSSISGVRWGQPGKAKEARRRTEGLRR